MKQTLMFIHSLYPTFPFACNDYNKIIDLMRHDKKNRGQDINFSLLKDIGSLALNTVVGEEDIKNALDFLRETN
jgi:3-dehydroquinate synthase